MEEFSVFFSFQTDSHPKTNFHFIRDTLKDVCASINHYKVSPIVGFNTSTGTRKLTDHLLNAATSADVFIGDVTFTSEYNNHQYETITNEQGIEYFRISSKGSEKKYPNGNVLLETGYSWAKKDYQRTLLIMNAAYGYPPAEPLPADMRDIEFPLMYNLSEDKLLDVDYFEKEKSKLKNALRNKILDIIEYDRNHLKQVFDPISHHENWPFPNNRVPYILSKHLISKIDYYRSVLEIPGKQIAYAGPAKSGKTRLAYELFKRNKPHFSRHRCLAKTYYYDFNFGSFETIHKPVLNMVRKKQHFVLILDNCNDLQIKNMKAITHGSLISLMFIKEI